MKLFKKRNSKFYWYEFTVRGRRYLGSTKRNEVSQGAEDRKPGTGLRDRKYRSTSKEASRSGQVLLNAFWLGWTRAGWKPRSSTEMVGDC